MNMDENIIFCNGLLKAAREDAKKAGIKIGHLTTWRSTGGADKYYQVWEGDKQVWTGSAYCASEAKSNYIFSLVEEATG
jgi:hypothetical protein